MSQKQKKGEKKGKKSSVVRMESNFWYVNAQLRGTEARQQKIKLQKIIVLFLLLQHKIQTGIPQREHRLDSWGFRLPYIVFPRCVPVKQDEARVSRSEAPESSV